MFYSEENSKTVKYQRADNFIPFDRKSLFDIDRLSTEAVKHGARVLELGCATGQFSRYLKETKNCSVVGVDFSEAQVSFAKPYCEKTFCGDLESDIFLNNIIDYIKSTNGVDVIMASAVLEHLKYPDKVLIKLKEVLKDDGVCIVTLPNVAHLYMRLKFLKGKWKYEDYGVMDRTHLRFFTFDSALELIEGCGYRLNFYDVTSCVPRALSILKHFCDPEKLEKAMHLIYKKYCRLIAWQFLFVCKKMEE